MKNTTNTSKGIEPEIGSDEWMIAQGFRKATPEERKECRKFMKRESWISILVGMLRQNKIKREGAVQLAWQTGASFVPDGHREEGQPHTPQSEGTVSVGCSPQTATSQIVHCQGF